MHVEFMLFIKPKHSKILKIKMTHVLPAKRIKVTGGHRIFPETLYIKRYISWCHNCVAYAK